MADIALLPCPFCGSGAEIERRGDHSTSTQYSCDSCGCFLETGEEWDHGRQWNARADDWRPIETAPKDGRRLWLYEPSYGYEGWWHTDFWRGEAYWMDDADSEPQPTHWRPLPAPPQVKTA